MEQETVKFESSPFSYDILDSEAHKISQLIVAVQKKCMEKSTGQVASDLFEWADVFTAAGRTAEAEFLYLHIINICERHHAPQYPMVFGGLRQYALTLKNAVLTSGSLPNIEPLFPAPNESSIVVANSNAA